MRITRAAKIAAFPLTALILVALIACQGPAGPAGAAGVKGDTGAAGKDGKDGKDGTMGQPGTPAFQAKADVGPVLLNDSDLVDKEGRKIDADTATPAEAKTKTMYIDLGRYFVGGAGEYEYSIESDWTAGSETDTVNEAANTAIEAKVNDSMLEYTLTIPDGGWTGTAFGDAADLYTNGFMATVRGTNNDIADDATVTIMLNRPPMYGADTNNDGVLDISVSTVVVLGVQERNHLNAAGTEDEDRSAVDGFYKAAKTINQIVLDVFTDDGDIETVEVVSITRDDVMDSSRVGWSADGADVTLTGMASTWNADANPPAENPVIVKLKATDEGKLSAEVSVQVAVNAPPMVSKDGAAVDRMVKTNFGTPVTLSSSPAGLFTDPEGDTITVSAQSSNEAIATVEDTLVVTPIARGTVTITVTGRTAGTQADGLWQEATMEFTVMVE